MPVQVRPVPPVNFMQEKGETVEINDNGFVVCPKCGKQTKTKVLPDTELKRFPLFCPWCKRETVIDK